MGQRTPKKGANGKARGAKRRDLYQEVTDRIIGQLEAGTFPWVQPWDGKAAGPSVGLPRNASTAKSYSGMNILLMWGATFERGFPSLDFLTFKQALALGGAVRKGERGSTVVYADRFTPESEKEKARESGEAAREVAFLKRYTVFHVSQCDGLPDDLLTGGAPLPERQAIPRAEALIKATGADFRIGGGRAYYAPGPDFIQVPPQPAFREQNNYYRTCFHELGHWTGHASRLDRNLTTSFGTTDYAREELVRRLLALKELAKEDRLPKECTDGIPVRLGSKDQARQASLSAGLTHRGFHPAEEYRQFARLLEDGKTVSKIAKTYSVAEREVEKRLKLARLAPPIFDAFARDVITIEQAQAFALTDDHDRQMALLEPHGFDIGAHAIRRPHRRRDARHGQ
ncbi:ArdC-like ssDNA-binding domain-containing protein [Parvularcula sp. BGMRC 0090]|uniref:ArdC-like ssDNA-binding domain-containing protein n=1 Tax=Parvularcula maris TaxID=2965077 RepID=A0A9X2LBN2_9PROT|nr:ArdC-like ssDNA-binding domain-containing protein [Parvularcula maris]MCQ8186504.1 ArdC-like ssDNA-binding domain-containing protein [Parvularcula maris]